MPANCYRPINGTLTMKDAIRENINLLSGQIFRLTILFLVLFPALASGQYKSLNYTGAPLPYLGYVPENYEGNKDGWPLMIFLHGIGEKGDGSPEDLKKVSNWGPPALVSEGKMPGGFIIIAPQLPKKESAWKPEFVDEVITFVMDRYKVDRNKVYLTGLSLGGNGVWRYAYSSYNSRNKLAAIAPVAAWGDPDKACEIINRNIPVWAFHGDRDQTIEYNRGKDMFDALADCGKELSVSDYRFTTFENTGHNSWAPAYQPEKDELNVYEWMLYHKLSSPASNRSGKVSLETIAELPASLPEASGMAEYEGKLWLHNDSGSSPFLIQLDTTGKITGHLKIGRASNLDWEDMTSDKQGNIYIGDIGNNSNERRELIIYKINPQMVEDDRVRADLISFTYPDQQSYPPTPEKMMYDAETLIHIDNHLYIFTKNRTVPFTGYTRIYRVPDVPGNYTAELTDSLQLEGENMIDGWITGGDISPDGKLIALLGHQKVYLLSCFSNGFSNAKMNILMLDSFTQKEAIAFYDNHTLYIADESFQNLLKGKLYRLLLTDLANSTCD